MLPQAKIANTTLPSLPWHTGTPFGDRIQLGRQKLDPGCTGKESCFCVTEGSEVRFSTGLRHKRQVYFKSALDLPQTRKSREACGSHLFSHSSAPFASPAPSLMVFSITRGALGLTRYIIELKILGLCTWVTGKVTEMVFHHPVKSDLEGMGVSINCPLFCHVSGLGRGSHKQREGSFLAESVQ